MTKVFQENNQSEPQIPEALLLYLEAKFPLQGFMNARGEDQFYKYQGAQEVIEHLRVLYNAQHRET